MKFLIAMFFSLGLIGCHHRHHHRPQQYDCKPVYKDVTEEWGITSYELEKFECKPVYKPHK